MIEDFFYHHSSKALTTRVIGLEYLQLLIINFLKLNILKL